MKNIICIDLTKFNNEKLKEVSVKTNIRYDLLVNNKKNNFAKLFFDMSGDGVVIAFTTKKDKNRVVYTDVYSDNLLELKSIEIVKQPVQLELDSVLEKISKYGIDSLSVLEKDFLDNLSK